MANEKDTKAADDATKKSETEEANRKAALTEKRKATQEGSVEGARSVAEAVRKVADAAVAEIQKQPVGQIPELIFTGTPGGRFTIYGAGNLGPSGTVKVNGADQHTREWSTSRIVGDLAAGTQPGTVEVHVDDKTVRRGEFKAALPSLV